MDKKIEKQLKYLRTTLKRSRLWESRLDYYTKQVRLAKDKCAAYDEQMISIADTLRAAGMSHDELQSHLDKINTELNQE